MRIHYLFGILLLLSSCFKEEEPIFEPGSGQTVLVLNEGNFQWGNASITRYDQQSGKVIAERLFEQTNGFAVGDVLQSATRIDDLLYLVVNNSGLIHICDAKTYVHRSSIKGLRSPRFITQLKSNPNYALISDLYLDSISLIDLRSEQVEKRIAIPGWTEGLLSYNGICYVSNKQSRSIYLIDESTLNLTDSIAVGLGSFDLELDQQQHLWVACKGDNVDLQPGSLYEVDPSTGNVIDSYPFDKPIAAYAYNSTWDQHFIISDQLYRLNKGTRSFETFGDLGTNRVLYGLAADQDALWVSDAKDYIQNGEVYLLDQNGQTIGQFTAGKIPGGFLFEK